MTIKLLLVDNDGTFIPGTEVRNRVVLQGLVDEFAKKASDVAKPCTIDWSQVAGKPEPQIHDWVCTNGFASFPDYLSAEDFTARAKEGYRITEPDYTAREGMVALLTDLKAQGIGAAIVTNSDREPILHSLKQSFDKLGMPCDMADVFPLIVTADEVKEQGLSPKPSPDPFLLALNIYNEMHGTDIQCHEVLILEDSPTGVKAGREMTNTLHHVVQFVDLAPACPDAGHHFTSVEQIRSRFFPTLAAPRVAAA